MHPRPHPQPHRGIHTNSLFTETLQQHTKYTNHRILLVILLLLLLSALVLRLVRSLVSLLRSGRVWVLLVLATAMTTMARRHDRWPALEVDVHAAGVGFRYILQAELLADLLDAGLDLLDMVDGVVALADDSARERGSVSTNCSLLSSYFQQSHKDKKC
jgi:hypothetical protein